MEEPLLCRHLAGCSDDGFLCIASISWMVATSQNLTSPNLALMSWPRPPTMSAVGVASTAGPSRRADLLQPVLIDLADPS